MGIPNRFVVLAALSMGCGGSYGYADDSGYRASTGSTQGGSSGTSTTLPPEIEDDFLALTPAQTDLYVFIANPSRNTVSRVNVDTLAVITTDVGADPRLIATTPDLAQAVVFNRADDSVSILDAETLDQTIVPVRDDLNQMRLSPDSRFAVLWHDLAAERPDDPPPDGLQSFNEASFVNLTTGEHSGMAVGYNPRDVVFTPDGSLAAIVSDEVLALVDLNSSPLLPQLIPLTADLDPPVAEEVVITNNGDFAFVRQFGSMEVLVVDLNTQIATRVNVGDNPTDLDLTPDGTRAVAVTRTSEELWVFDALDPLAAPTVLALPPGLSLGSLIFDTTGDAGLLYTTASPTTRYAVWDLATDTFEVRNLVKQVIGAAVTPMGGHALFFHPPENPVDMPPEDPFYNHHALTMLRIEDGLSNPLLLPAEPVNYSLSDDGRYAYFGMRGQKFLETLDFQTLLHTQVALKSDPVHVGVMPDPDTSDADAPQAWVSQDHELGRISFFDIDEGSLETITGFELNSGIEHD